MTGDAVKVDGAIDTLSANGGEDYPEAYNLVFQNSSDPATGWRANSRKLVVVIGDAEPHGAGTAGFGGCSSRLTTRGRRRRGLWRVRFANRIEL